MKNFILLFIISSLSISSFSQEIEIIKDANITYY